MKLYEANNHLLIHSTSLMPSNHSHMAAHIIVCMHQEMKVKTSGREYCCKGIMIPSGVAHEIDTMGNAVLVFLYDNTTDVAMQINDVEEIEVNNVKSIVDKYNEFEKGTLRYYDFESKILTEIGITTRNQSNIDIRILEAMKFMEVHIAEKITCQDVANAVYLSQGRFSHLFKEQMGMTFAAYSIYQRIMYAYTLVYQGVSITEAALAAGFSSSGHFADVNRRIFGLSASDIFKEFEFIKVE